MVSQKVGSYAFLLGVVIAVLAGLVQLVELVLGTVLIPGIAPWVAIVLVVLGLIVGLLNIHDKHVSDFLIATIAVAMIGLVALNPAIMVVDPVVSVINAIKWIINYIILFSCTCCISSWFETNIFSS